LREQDIERRLVKMTKEMGGRAFKFTSQGTSGVPDRLLLFPGGRIAFAELKAPGKKLRPQQAVRKRQIEKLGFSVYVIDRMDQIGGVLDEILSV
jgi:hypothetical protein